MTWEDLTAEEQMIADRHWDVNTMTFVEFQQYRHVFYRNNHKSIDQAHTAAVADFLARRRAGSPGE